MIKRLTRGLIGTLIAAVLLSVGCSTIYREPRFVITEIKNKEESSGILRSWLTTEQRVPVPQEPLPLRPIPIRDLHENFQPVLYRLGHSTMLIRLDGDYILTDPIFSERASPVQWIGPKRFHPTPIEIDALPSIKAVIISHDHYDHLDKASIKALADKIEYFLTPLRVGDHLRRWGIEENKIVELDWWQHKQLGSLTLTATPAQHFSGRGLLDRDQTLWASWVIEGQQGKLFFSGDTGYFNGFKEIGERFGPFDITMIENGAYNAAWADLHMMPEESLQAHLDLQGKAMLPIHNSTFNLARHNWFDPLESIDTLAQQHKVQLITPVFGEAVSITNPGETYAWWREYLPVLASVTGG
ncbi:hydrolase [Pseudomaricurvus alkylphenolicus]|uniref:MBL fold metallo-hydrolase n=1 Tax=Pseudomaricurvus alkylphenolicus TaxID=1306991 RepID=UPI00141F6B08|nr:MBL fold metallo-hydrolase [Pseudomaricurvus alkylphenolicus]NIB41458.1 hydrolase [Pseudomaricurvus alkylphenolicus]